MMRLDDVDGRDKPGHDGLADVTPLIQGDRPEAGAELAMTVVRDDGCSSAIAALRFALVVGLRLLDMVGLIVLAFGGIGLVHRAA
jgi:hypothetical protein